ncbi:hypothetical protein Lgee_2074 [Legionella geestiana]|uniref:Uncharacterized protein n=1 Tax=Legionella geestiana TaxID=45065 RepID=A0A0W0TNG0_9GAMM|nr:DUF2878 domain-containing protein [Legionella geestiana]KTC97103.1 hypothetical protein Lgee_2074 [Legionella geestiana]QBS11459.1 DUF2878 domain-containing protein [Legionella geestiana]STX53879.1 Protein of uncharacterised function (DUF2878) [Legionella geestiana]
MKTYYIKLLHGASWYLAWFACIHFAAKGDAWTGTGITLCLIALQMLLQAHNRLPWRDALFFTVALSLLGTVTDTLWQYAGLVQFHANPFHAPVSPPWMTALWLSFGVNIILIYRNWLTHYLLWGSIVFPSMIFAYWLGVRVGAATVTTNPLYFYTALGTTWALLLPLCLFVFNHLQRKTQP